VGIQRSRHRGMRPYGFRFHWSATLQMLCERGQNNFHQLHLDWADTKNFDKIRHFLIVVLFFFSSNDTDGWSAFTRVCFVYIKPKKRVCFLFVVHSRIIKYFVYYAEESSLFACDRLEKKPPQTLLFLFLYSRGWRCVHRVRFFFSHIKTSACR